MKLDRPDNEGMAHPRKKGGVRKDKKVARMREDLAWRKGFEKPEHPTNDQNDVITYKPGSQSDHNRHTPPP